MEAHRTPIRWTYERYASLPDSWATRYEVIADQVVVTPPPTLWHQVVVGNLTFSLSALAREHGLGLVIPGPADVLFQQGDYFQPDLLFVRADRLEIMARRGVEKAPDLAIEVLSPSTRRRDRGIKLDRYRMFGVREYWIVDLDARRIEVWRFEAGADAPTVLGTTDTLKWRPIPEGDEYEIPVSRFFEGIP
jgi:Uma2 family endonuclease